MDGDQLNKLNQANYLHITGQLDKALQQYVLLQAEGLQDNYELVIQTAIAYTQLNQYESALKECEKAIQIDGQRPEGLFRRGIANFNSCKIKQALVDFQDVSKKSENDQVLQQQIQVWIGKCNAELENKSLESILAQETTIQQQPKEQTGPSKVAPKAESDKIKYTWYQTDSLIGIEINYGLSKSTDAKVEFSDKSGSISFPTSESSNYNLDLDLWAEVKPETAKVTTSLNQILVTVDKKVNKLHWKSLLSDGKDQVAEKKQERKPIQAPVNDKIHSYPSSSQTKKDWTKIDLEIEEDMKNNREDYADGDPANELFKQIYANADENTKKAMVKSFQTSGGTVLSTNWDEVKGKDYEGKDRPSPPKGQKWGKWEK